MAVELKGIDIPMKASANVPGGGIAQYTAVVIDVAGGSGPFDVIQATVTTQPIFGINQDQGDQLTVNSATPPTVLAGESLRVRVAGISRAVAGGAITAGQFLQVNASGQLVAITSLNPATTATNTYVVGQALTPATALGDIFTVALMQGIATLVTT